MTTTMVYKPNGKTYELHEYVDPHPDKKARDRISWKENCTRCGGTGVYRWWTSYGQAAGTCFGCWGAGRVTVSRAVYKLRQAAKDAALWAEYADELHAYHEEQAEIARAAQKAAEQAEAWEEAHAEQERRAALTQGFLGEPGEKITNIPVTIRYAKYCEAPAWNRQATMFIIAESETGQAIKISGSSASLFGAERGQNTTILSAKVKAHGEYNGQQQTILSHVRLDDFEKRASDCLAYGFTDADEAIEKGRIEKGERERFEAFMEAARAEYEKELLDA